MDIDQVVRTDTETKARYALALPGIDEEAELTLSKVTPQLVIADHTFVPDAMRGKGVGGILVNRLIADVRAKGQRIVPLCPYVRAQARKHKDEWADVIQW